MVDLYGANLERTIWVDAAMHFANLGSTNLTEANLTGASLSWANLENAILHKAILKGAVFKETQLKNAELQSADLSGANFKRSNFYNARFDADTKLDKTNFFQVDLTQIQKIGDVDFSKIITENQDDTARRVRRLPTRRMSHKHEK